MVSITGVSDLCHKVSAACPRFEPVLSTLTWDEKLATSRNSSPSGSSRSARDEIINRALAARLKPCPPASSNATVVVNLSVSRWFMFAGGPRIKDETGRPPHVVRTADKNVGPIHTRGRGRPRHTSLSFEFLEDYLR